MLKIAKKLENQKKESVKNIQQIFLEKILSYEGVNYLSNNLTINKYFRILNLCLLSAYTSFSKNRNFCLITGRTRSVYKIFKLSRIKIREYGNKGKFLGFSKTSW